MILFLNCPFYKLGNSGMEKPSNFLKVTKLLGGSCELRSSSMPVCAVQDSKVQQRNGDGMGFGVIRVGLNICSCTSWVLRAKVSCFTSLSLRFFIYHIAGDDGSLAELLDDMNYVHHRHSEMMGFLLHFPSDIKDSRKATVWALPSLMGSCSWLQ